MSQMYNRWVCLIATSYALEVELPVLLEDRERTRTRVTMDNWTIVANNRHGHSCVKFLSQSFVKLCYDCECA